MKSLSERVITETVHLSSEPAPGTCPANKRTPWPIRGRINATPPLDPSLGATHRISLSSNKVLLILNPQILWNFAGMAGIIIGFYFLTGRVSSSLRCQRSSWVRSALHLSESLATSLLMHLEVCSWSAVMAEPPEVLSVSRDTAMVTVRADVRCQHPATLCYYRALWGLMDM